MLKGGGRERLVSASHNQHTDGAGSAKGGAGVRDRVDKAMMEWGIVVSDLRRRRVIEVKRPTVKRLLYRWCSAG
jgi:hypothetical protein